MAVIHLQPNGYWRFSEGYVQNDQGCRVQKFHSLGRDKKVAQSIANAIEIAWKCEIAKDGNGKKIWTPDRLKAAINFAAPKQTPPTPSNCEVSAKANVSRVAQNNASKAKVAK